MPKGSGKGGNNPGARKASEPMHVPSPKELLLRRLEVHRDGAAGRLTTESPGYHALMIDKVLAEIAELEEAGVPKLEAMEGHAQLSAEFAKQKSLAEMNLSERTINTLEDYGVLYAGELCGWTEQRLLSCDNVGASALTEIKKSLADIGLRLREPVDGEIERPPVRQSRVGSREGSGKSPHDRQRERRAQKRRIVMLLAAGKTHREAAKELGKASRAVVSEVSAEVRQKIAAHVSGQQIAKDFGFVIGGPRFVTAAEYFRALIGRKSLP